MPAAERRRPAPRPPARDATGRSVACAPRPRSWSCECCGRFGAGSNHRAKVLSFWNRRNRHANWIMPRRPERCRNGPALSAFSAALVGRAREAGITRYGRRSRCFVTALPAPAVGRLDTNPDHPRHRCTIACDPSLGACLYGAFFVKEFARASNLLSFVSFFVRSQSPFLRPDPRFADVVARRSCQGWPSHQPFPTSSAVARPHLDSFEHDGTLGAIGMTIRGEPAFGRGSVAPQPCIRWVQGPEP